MIGTILTYALGIYVAIMLGMFLFQRNLMYYPETHIQDPGHYDLPDANVVELTTNDNLNIHIWHHQASNPELPLMVYFHGNAGHVGDRTPKLRHYADAGFGIIALSYRGYGKSQGVPSERGLYEDARVAVQYALGELNYKASQIIIYGESLGSGVATHTAKTLADLGTPIGGLVLEAPYTSVARRSQEMYPFLPAFYLVKDKYHSIDKIDTVSCPLLLFHGALDTVIPIHHGKALLEKAKEPKQGVFFDDVDHTAFDYAALTEHLLEFVNTNDIKGM